MHSHWVLRFIFCLPACAALQLSAAPPGPITSLAGYSGILSEAREAADAQSAGAQTNDAQSATPQTNDAQSGVYPSPNAPKTPPAIYQPYTVGQKFKFATTDSFGPVALVGVGVAAGFSQLTNTPGPWGQGAAGYGRRYGSAFGVNLSNEYFDAILNSTLHEDPRYFPSKDRSVKGRVRHAVAYLFITRDDNGGSGPAYARWGGALGAGFLANSWNPRTDNRASDALERAGVILAADAGLHLVEEFIPFFRHLAP